MRWHDEEDRVYDRELARRAARRFYAVAALLLVGIALVAHLLDRWQAQRRWTVLEQAQVASATFDIHRRFGDSLSDLRVLARHREWFEDSPSAREALTRAFVYLAEERPFYQQLRLLDATGRERVRVQTEGGRVRVFADAALQDKSHRYYFQAGLALQPGEVYVSPMDLNVEHGEIERPLRPMIRFVTPVTDRQGRVTGVLVANFAAAVLLDVLAEHDRNTPAKLMLLNRDGYWLYSRDREDAWGFQLPHGRSFAARYPEVWPRIAQAREGQLQNDSGLFSFRAVGNAILPAGSRQVLASEPEWLLASLVEDGLLYGDVAARGWVLLTVTLLLLLLLAPLSRRRGVREAIHAYKAQRLQVYGALIQQSDEMVYVVSAEGRIQFVNPAVQRAYGYSEHELIGKSPSLFKSGQHPQGFYELLWRTVSAGEIFEGLFVNRRKDGSLLYEAKRILPLQADGAGQGGYVSLGRDLTGITQGRLQGMRSLARLSSRVQHHFNNLLQGVMGFLQLAMIQLERRNMGDAKKLIGKSLESAARVEELVAQIARSGSLHARSEERVDLAAMATQLVDGFRQHRPAGVSLSLEIDDQLPRPPCDAQLVSSAMQALIGNACDAVAEDGHVCVHVGVLRPLTEICVNCRAPIRGDHLVVSVSDDGPGISQGDLEDVFEPFFSTKQDADLVATTPGLGLTIVRSVAHVHDGHVLLDSEKGVGTTVRLLLPLQPPQAD